MSRPRAFILILFLGLMAALFAFVSVSPRHTSAQASTSAWLQAVNILPADTDITGVFMMDAENVWLAGNNPAGEGRAFRIRWDGTRWSLLHAQTFAYAVYDVVAVSDQNVWVVGAQDMLLQGHYTSDYDYGWSVTILPWVGATFTTIQMLGNGDEGWAGGYISPQPDVGGNSQLILMHYEEGNWTRDDSISGEGYINSLHFTSGGGWAVGSGIWRYESGRWTREQDPEFCPDTVCYGAFAGVRAISGDEAWAVGTRAATCGICFSVGYAAHRTGDRWVQALETGTTSGGPSEPFLPGSFQDVTFTSPDHGFVVGHWTSRTDQAVRKPLLAVFDAGAWTYQSLPDVQTALHAVSAADADHVLAVGSGGIILSRGYSYNYPVTPPAQATPGHDAPPTTRVADPHDPDVTYFDLVGHTLRGPFRDYWRQHGGLEQFGYPLTEEYTEQSPTDGKPYTVQYFERARFEHHPENQPPYNVLLGLLGRTVTQGRENEEPFRPVPPKSRPAVGLYFPETSHTLAPEFVVYWESHGGLPVYGYPISEPFTEVSKTDGKPYLVQYFERNRLEYHPELPEAYRVSLGLLGADILRTRGWLP
jgi:hypothetical protein